MLHFRHTGEGRRSFSVECTLTTFVSTSSLASPLSAKLCSMSVHPSIYDLEFYLVISRLIYMLHLRHSGEGRRSLSVEYTPPTLVSTSSSLSPLSAKVCSMSVHQSVHGLQFYLVISWQMHFTWGIVGWAVDLCPSNAHLQLWCLPAPHYPLCLLKFFHDCASIRSRFRILPLNYQTNAWIYMLHLRHRAIDLFQSNASWQLLCLLVPHHPLCLLNFVPWACINPFMI